jgi:hypothetical protein
MVKEALVGLDLTGGQKVLDTLDAANFKIPVALWIRRGEDDEKWRLLLASPLYDSLGPGEAYHLLVKTLWSGNYDWVRSPIQLQTTRQPLVRELRKNFPKAADVIGMRLGGQMIGGEWVDDAYVYRIR